MVSTIPQNIPVQDRPDTIQVPFLDFFVDWEVASRSIKPFPGYVYVEMAPYQEKFGVLHLLDDTQRAKRADVGICIAVGADRDPEEKILTASGYAETPLPLEVKPGDVCLVDPYRGDMFEGFAAGPYRTKRMVRLYGDASADEFRYRARQVDETIMATVLEEPTKIGNLAQNTAPKKRLRPVGRYCLIQREPLPETTSAGVVLPDRERIRRPFATILEASAAAQAHGRMPGMRVQYRQMCAHPLKMYDLELADELLAYDCPLADLALVPYENLTAQI